MYYVLLSYSNVDSFLYQRTQLSTKALVFTAHRSLGPTCWFWSSLLWLSQSSRWVYGLNEPLNTDQIKSSLGKRFPPTPTLIANYQGQTDRQTDRHEGRRRVYQYMQCFRAEDVYRVDGMMWMLVRARERPDFNRQMADSLSSFSWE